MLFKPGRKDARGKPDTNQTSLLNTSVLELERGERSVDCELLLEGCYWFLGLFLT